MTVKDKAKEERGRIWRSKEVGAEDEGMHMAIVDGSENKHLFAL